MHGDSTRRLVVASGGNQVVGQVGLHALGAFADRLGLGNALSSRIPPRGERMPLHDRGYLVVQSMLMLAGGDESCSDIEHLRTQEDLSGETPSDSTVFRAFHEIIPDVRDALAEAFAQVRAEVWRRSAATMGTAPVTLDIDASLVEIHTETKEGTGPHYKGGWGFHPIFCFADATDEAFSGLLRPGSAGANTVADHVSVLDEAVARLPAQIALGHHVGGDGSLVARPLVVLADSAGCTRGFVWAARPATSGISWWPAQMPRSTVRSSTVGLEEIWAPALHQDGSPREGAAVADLSELVDLSEWPEGTRLIVRREPPHPGAQHSLFPSLEYRYWCHYSDQDGEAVELDQTIGFVTIGQQAQGAWHEQSGHQGCSRGARIGVVLDAGAKENGACAPLRGKEAWIARHLPPGGGVLGQITSERARADSTLATPPVTASPGMTGG